MRFKLFISRREDAADCSGAKRFRFTVVDLDEAKDYPLNFVCMLPLRLELAENRSSKFVSVFGDGSLNLARKLLVDALKIEDDVAVRSEIERRLKMLETDCSREKKCVSCGSMFQVDSKKRFKQRFCEVCIKRKFGSRE